MGKVAIVGSGLMGRILALMFLKNTDSIEIDLYDRDSRDGKLSCGYHAGGMLSPVSELSSCHQGIFDWGCDSVSLWLDLIKWMKKVKPNQSVDILDQKGTIMIAHAHDSTEIDYYDQKISYYLHQASKKNSIEIERYTKDYLSKFEPGLQQTHLSNKILYVKNEAVIDVGAFFELTTEILNAQRCINWYDNTNVCEIYSSYITTDTETKGYDLVFDCRGLDAKDQLPNIYAVRGEALVIYQKSVHFNHVIRLMHPRYCIYLIPRGNGIFYLGATSIISEDYSNISVESSMELLSALHVIDKRFSEARILKMISHCRPVSDSDLPIIKKEKNLIYLNGLSRHGYLFSPKVALNALELSQLNNIVQKKESDNVN